MARLLIALSICALVAGSYSQTIGLENPACDNKQVIVHLFEWKWEDIALECERFLSQNEFCGVQVSPPNENAIITSDYPRPWWERYQPVSYTLETRSGTREEFIDMVQRCNAVGVRIFVDAVVNDMAAVDREGLGTAGNSFSGPNQDFPAVPYTEEDFTPRDMCPSGSGGVDDYSDPNNVRNCDLSGLSDLYGAYDDVRQKVSAYFNDLIEIGVAGFRVDAAKHMWPDDIQAIQDLTNDLNVDQGFPAGTRPFFYHEVIDRNDGAVTVQQYYGLGRITEFRYSQKIAWGIQDFTQLYGVYDPGWYMADPDKAFVFVDNHDNQRGHGGAGDVITYKYPHDYRLGVAFTLAQPYGYTRIMSSYDFGDDTDVGPPHHSDMSTDNVPIDSNNQCYGGWVCEHRWSSITKIVRFRNAVLGTDWLNYYSDSNVCAFSRGDIGFFAMVKLGTLSQSFQTGLPAGTYEELISCKSVTVEADGTALVEIDNEDEPVFAICQGCSCEDAAVVTATPETDATTSPTPPPVTVPAYTDGTRRTVVFVHIETIEGQDLFIRGGIDSSVRSDCTEDAETDPCAIPISTNSLGDTTHYDKYNSWREGDLHLDWFGAEPGQGTYNSEEASGSPLAWTSSDSSNEGYQELNIYGDHYWMIDFDMNCTQTQNGWFEIKSYLTNSDNGWESDIVQASTCSGTAGGITPYTTANHLGKCGFVNVFTFGSTECRVEVL
ncbi:UNVERIFIED_CONTAM: hypothetical protein RMT77_004217 [Armadillidium vulgare]